MNKKEFLKELKGALSTLPRRERKERISFYSEIIDDKIEEGTPEKEAIKEVGSVSEIAAKSITEAKNSISEIPSSRRSFTTQEKVVMIVGAPLWIPLAIAALAIIFSLYLIAYALLLTLWAVELPFLLMSLLSKALFPACTAASKLFVSFTTASFKKLTPWKKGKPNKEKGKP